MIGHGIFAPVYFETGACRNVHGPLSTITTLAIFTFNHAVACQSKDFVFYRFYTPSSSCRSKIAPKSIRSKVHHAKPSSYTRALDLHARSKHYLHTQRSQSLPPHRQLNNAEGNRCSFPAISVNIHDSIIHGLMVTAPQQRNVT